MMHTYINKQTDRFSNTTTVLFQNGKRILAFAERYHQAEAKHVCEKKKI